MSLNSVSFEDELGRNSALKKSDIELLKKWCDDEFYSPSTSNSDLSIFLHSSYYYVETAKLNIQNYYNTRQSLPQFFQNRVTNSEEMKKICDTLAIIPLPTRTQEGYKVILIRPLEVVRNNVLSTETIKLFNMILDLNIHEEGTHEGYVFVFDVQGANFFDPSSFDPMAMKKYFDYLQKCAPIRWFGLHFINTVFPFTQGNQFTRMTIVQNDFFDAMYFHLDLESLNEVVPLHALPNEMGGEAGPLKDLHEAQMAKLRQNEHWFSMMDLQETSARIVRRLCEIAKLIKDQLTKTEGRGNAPISV